MNELLFFISLISAFSLLLLVYRLFGKSGLFGWICFSTVFANIEVLKTVTCFGLSTTLGNTLFGTIFLATDILSEQFDRSTAKKAIFLGFICNLAFVIFSQLDMAYIPNDTDIAHNSFAVLFKLTPRVCLGSVIAYAVGNLTDVYLYEKIKNRHGKKHMWFRNNVCTLLSQLLDNFIFHFIAFSSVMTFDQIAKLSVNVWIIEAIVAILDTPFLYIAKNKIPCEFK